jgi:hypothetical protein
MSQKVVQYQAVMQMAQANPQTYDLAELNKQMSEVLGVKNIGKLIPSKADHRPRDPVSENMSLINGQPVKAFSYQDHQAHITVHMAALQDPKMAAIIGQNPMAQQIQAATMAHINEHVAFEYRKQIEEQLGAALPKPDEELPSDAEFEISKLMAEAAQQLLQKDQAEVQQQQAAQQAQDPLIQMQQQELQLKQQEVQIKAQKTMADIQLDQEKLMLEKAKLDSQERIAGAQLGAKTTLEKQKTAIDVQKFQSSQQARGVELGLDVARTHLDRQHTKEINMKDQIQPKE